MAIKSVFSKSKIDLTFLKFIVVGVINTLLSLIVIFLLKYFFAVADAPANFTGYIIGLICSFFLNKKWTYNHKGQFIVTAIRFLVVFAIAYVANIIAVLQFIDNGVNSYLSHMLGMPVYTIVFYFGTRFFVFRPEQNDLK